MPKAFQFTEENVIYIKENWGKETITNMSNEIGCSRKALSREAKKLGFIRKDKVRWETYEDNLLKEKIGTLSVGEIADVLGRTTNSVYNRITKLGIAQNVWTPEEEALLEDTWGCYSIETIAKNLEKTPEAIRKKVTQKKLGPAFEANGQYLKVSEIENILNVSGDRIRKNWFKKGLKVHKVKISEKKRIYGIKIADLFTFLEQHQDYFDARFLEENILGPEPEWLKNKRKQDFKNPPPEYRIWQDNEIKILTFLLSKGKSYREIGTKINRSVGAVKAKTLELELGLSRIWSEEEYKVLKENFIKGSQKNYNDLALELGRGYYGVAKKCKKLGYNNSKTSTIL